MHSITILAYSLYLKLHWKDQVDEQTGIRMDLCKLFVSLALEWRSNNYSVFFQTKYIFHITVTSWITTS
jgi:hypothetical protein